MQFDVKRVQKGVQSFMVSFDFTKTPITQIADYIIIAASKHGASDIHFDPRENGMMVRFRIDGDCQDYTFIPLAYEKNLTTRLKLIANMNITESRLPQDGAIKGDYGGTYLDMRVSSLPLNEGEKIVIRILDYSRSLQGVETLGFHPENLQKVKRMMEIPNGIILTTGATGSGKSTTTYSILQGLNRPETNIITVEDPIEMNIEGINQVQVNSEIGMTFAAALRSILRQDPNIILIGEIRDSETAQIAVRASITGHLVLSTIHTNNALATVERLLDMDVERYLLSTALSGIISQRLAKMLCPDCRYQRETTKYEKKVFKKYMHLDIPTLWDANPKGCDHCRNGYKGRIAVHEVLELDDDIRNALNNENLEKKELAKLVYGKKTITMLQDALIKCLDGKTSFEEVYRTIEIENEDDDNYEEEVKVVAEQAPKEEPMEEESDDLLGGSKGNEIRLNVGMPPINEAPEEENKEAPGGQVVQIPQVTPPAAQPTVEAPVDNLAPEDQMQQTVATEQPTVEPQPQQAAAPEQPITTPEVTAPTEPAPTQPEVVQIPQVAPPQAQTTEQVVQQQPAVQSIIPAITEVNPAPVTQADQVTNPTSIVPEVTSVEPQATKPITPEVESANIEKPPEIKTFDIKKPDDLPKEALLTPIIPNITTGEDGNISSNTTEVQAPLTPRFDKLEKL